MRDQEIELTMDHALGELSRSGKFRDGDRNAESAEQFPSAEQFRCAERFVVARECEHVVVSEVKRFGLRHRPMSPWKVRCIRARRSRTDPSVVL
ncbi:MAG: hypothetical protein RIR10_1469, partial [Planctomycetota bacterium]